MENIIKKASLFQIKFVPLLYRYNGSQIKNQPIKTKFMKTKTSKKSATEDGLDALTAIATAKPTSKTAAAAKDIFAVTGEVAKAMTVFAKGKTLIEQGEAMKAEAEGIIKPHCMEKWAAEFDRTGARPESNVISNGKNEEDLLFITVGKYRQIKDVEEFNRLKETYGEDIAEKKVEFTLNPALVQKYGAVLANFIKNSKDIADADKGKLIQSKTGWAVAKDAIASLKKFADKAKTSILAVAEDLAVQKQLKIRGDE